MNKESGDLCVWCGNDDCVLNHIGTRGPALNFCMPEITGCLDFRDCLEEPGLTGEVSK